MFAAVAVMLAGLLQLCAAQDGVNLALGKNAWQDSDFNVDVSPASNSVDGNTNPDYWAGSCSANNAGNPGWWVVDLGGFYNVEEVYVTNRGNSAISTVRLHGGTVAVGSEFDASTFDPTSYNVCANLGDIPGGRHHFECSRPINGRYVTVYITTGDYLNFCELEVYGTVSGRTTTQNSTPVIVSTAPAIAATTPAVVATNPAVVATTPAVVATTPAIVATTTENVITTSGNACPGDTWYEYAGHCYSFITRPRKNFADALGECNATVGASLLKIDTGDELPWIIGTINADPKLLKQKKFWTSGKAGEDGFIWANDGTPVEVVDWGKTPKKISDCIALEKSSDYKYRVSRCSGRLAYICEL